MSTDKRDRILSREVIATQIPTMPKPNTIPKMYPKTTRNIHMEIIDVTDVKRESPAALSDDFSATFTTALMEKDIDLALAAADETGVQLPIARHLKGLLRAAIEGGYGDDDFIALYLQLRNSASKEVVR